MHNFSSVYLVFAIYLVFHPAPPVLAENQSSPQLMVDSFNSAIASRNWDTIKSLIQLNDLCDQLRQGFTDLIYETALNSATTAEQRQQIERQRQEREALVKKDLSVTEPQSQMEHRCAGEFQLELLLQKGVYGQPQRPSFESYVKQLQDSLSNRFPFYSFGNFIPAVIRGLWGGSIHLSLTRTRGDTSELLMILTPPQQPSLSIPLLAKDTSSGWKITELVEPASTVRQLAEIEPKPYLFADFRTLSVTVKGGDPDSGKRLEKSVTSQIANALKPLRECLALEIAAKPEKEWVVEVEITLNELGGQQTHLLQNSEGLKLGSGGIACLNQNLQLPTTTSVTSSTTIILKALITKP